MFVQTPDHAWLYAGITVALWIGWYVQREAGPFRPMDLGLVWGFFLLSLLLLAAGWNRIEVRVAAHGIERQVGPFRVLEGNQRFQRSDIAGVHYWQAAVQSRRLDQGPTRTRFNAGIRRRNGSDIDLVGGFSDEADAARAAEAIAKVWGLTPTRLPRGNEPMGWRGVLFLLAIPISPLIVARLADFFVALVRG